MIFSLYETCYFVWPLIWLMYDLISSTSNVLNGDYVFIQFILFKKTCTINVHVLGYLSSST